MAIHDLQHQNETHHRLFRMLPSVDDLLLTSRSQEILKSHRRSVLIAAVREALDELRFDISSGNHTEDTLQECIKLLPDQIDRHVAAGMHYSLRPVINATGVILHTNLGRAPLSEAALNHITEIAKGYCNLEFDLESGMRSRRDVHAESLVLQVLNQTAGSRADARKRGVIIVNNCAAATILALNSLAEKTEVIVSRGELVEIGGGFRIPEIMEKSGAILKEVGTTNRTRLDDFSRAIGSETGLLLRVHQSNFSIDGFAERPALEQMVSLSKRSGIPLFEDQGTGLISSLEHFGIRGEPSFTQSFACGVDLIAASGDKLLGGPQCGILVGRQDLIERIRKNPLLRAFRVDKLTYAALEATLMEYLHEDSPSLPIERMLSIPSEELMRRCREIADQIVSTHLVVDVLPVTSLVGGGTAPKATLQSGAISLRHRFLAAGELLAALRELNQPIIGRIAGDAVILDLRTVPPHFDAVLTSQLRDISLARSE